VNYHSSDPQQSTIQAHLALAEGRTTAKRTQHLTSATETAKAAGIETFGRWSEQSVTARNAQFKERQRIAGAKNGTKPDEQGAAAGRPPSGAEATTELLAAPTAETSTEET
jgi:hypothetical protein